MFKYIFRILSFISPKKETSRRVLTFHGIEEEDKYSLSLEHFENILSSLLDYKFVFPDDELSKETTREVSITFDDGRKSVLKAVPILKKYNIKATFYIITSKVFDGNTEYLNSDDINSLLLLGHRIGSHSHTHKILSSLDEKSLKFELEESKNILCKTFNLDNIGFAIPYGQENTFNNKILDSILAYDFKHVCTQIPGNVKNTKVINRSGINKSHSKNDVHRMVNGKYDFVIFIRKVIIFMNRIFNKESL